MVFVFTGGGGGGGGILFSRDLGNYLGSTLLIMPIRMNRHCLLVELAKIYEKFCNNKILKEITFCSLG